MTRRSSEASNWQIREWNEANAETLKDLPGYGFFKAAIAARKWAMASDWLRMAALYAEGGVYLDYDVELVREIDSLEGEWVASEWAVGGGSWLNPGSGIALKKGSVIASSMLKAYESAGFDASRDMMPWINQQLTEASSLTSPALRVLPPEVFSPIDVNGACHQTAETRGIHHYAMSWAGPKRRVAKWLAWHGMRGAVTLCLRLSKRLGRARHSAALAIASVGPLMILAGGDPYDYKPLQVREVKPAAISVNAASHALVDFGRDAIGWFEFTGGPAGEFEIVLGEMTNASGQVSMDYPRSTIRILHAKGTKVAGAYRPPFPSDRHNLRGYDPKAPAIRLPAELGIVMPFRYVEIVKSPVLPDSSAFVQKAVNYPIDMGRSSFESDYDALDRVYDFCKYSILATSFCGVYVDGDRERTPYEADAYINQLAHYAIDDDYSLARKSHEWLMDHPTWPTEWKQHSIMMAWTDWMWTGDTRSIAKFYDRLKTQKLRGGWKTRADGLVVSSGDAGRGERDIIDWPRCERDGYELTNVCTVVNAFHYINLVQMGDIARALGKADDAAAFAKAAVAQKEAFNRVFFSESLGLYVDGEGSRHASLHANAAALAFGLVPEERKSAALDFLEAKGMACSVYFSQYLLEAFYRNGRPAAALRLMTAAGDRGWLGMMSFGSTVTMEAWNVKAKPNLDLNHAWSATPLSMVSRFVLGVTPLEPGFRKVRIAPQPGGLKKYRGTVPTNVGPVTVAVDGDCLTVHSPVPADIIWDGKTVRK